MLRIQGRRLALAVLLIQNAGACDKQGDKCFTNTCFVGLTCVTKVKATSDGAGVYVSHHRWWEQCNVDGDWLEGHSTCEYVDVYDGPFSCL